MPSDNLQLLGVLAEWFAAAGTIGAVIVALYLARKDRLVHPLGEADRSLLIDAKGHSQEFLAISVLNLATRPFTVSSIFWRTGIFRKKYWLQDLDPNPLSSRLPARLGDGEQARFFIPLWEWKENALPTIFPRRRQGFLSLASVRLQVRLSGDRRFNFRVSKSVRELIKNPDAA